MSNNIRNANELKERQRQERENYGDTLALRVHRAISWLARAEQCEDLDGRFMFLWVSFNAAYSNDIGRANTSESALFSSFISKLVDLDTHHTLYNIAWQKYSSAIRVLLDNKFVYQPFWNHHNGLDGFDNWEQSFNDSIKAAHRALGNKDTAAVLSIIFNRLYTLRNQLVHGGATYNSSVNRAQLRDATNILGDVVPVLIEIMMDNPRAHWGEAHYPLVNEL